MATFNQAPLGSLDLLAKQYFYTPEGKIDYILAGPDAIGRTFRQSMTYQAGKLIASSAWVQV